MAFAKRHGLGRDTNLKGMIRSLYSLFIVLVLGTSTAYGQIGGETIYNFLNLAPSARITGLGGSLISVVDEDPANAVYNPGLLNQRMHGGITFQNNFHFDGIYNG